MTRSPHCIGLICLAVFSGCQSIDSSLFPWQTANQTKYKTAEELAAMNNPQPVAARTEGEQDIQQTVMATASSQPVSTGRVQQLVQSGQAALRDGQSPAHLERARQDFQQALSLDAGNTDAHHGIAIVADLEDEWSVAEYHYKQALRQQPQDPGILNDLGYSYLLQNRYDESSQYLRQALHVAPQHEHAHINLALLALKRGDRRAAESQLAEIYTADDVNTTIARLEQDLQPKDANAIQVDVSQPLNVSFEETKRLMAEERVRSQRARQERANQEQQRLAAGGLQRPTGRFTPQPQQTTMFQPNTTSAYPVALNAGRTSTANVVTSYGYPTSPRPDIQHHGAGAAPRETFVNAPANSYPTGVAAAQMANVATHNTVPQFSGGQSAPFPQQGIAPHQSAHAAAPAQYERPLQQDHPAHYGVQTQFATRGSPTQGLIQQVTQPRISNRYGVPQPAAPVQQFQNAVPQNYQAPVAGLNTGPGALFPITTGNGSVSPAGMNQIRSSFSQTSTQPRFPGQNVGGVPKMMPGTNSMINGGMYQQPPRILPAEQHLQQMRYSQQEPVPTVQPPVAAIPSVGPPTFAAGGVLTPAESSPQSYGTHRSQQMAEGPAITQTTSTGTQPSSNRQGVGHNPDVQLRAAVPASPLAAYEQQLRGLNSQYNQAIQQVQDNRGGLNPVQARY
ncbi:MAG: hypothetical protein P8K08_14545 [Fuerstiella sp.]|nr:hypothetical protein [Fuerstiella sp.]